MTLKKVPANDVKKKCDLAVFLASKFLINQYKKSSISSGGERIFYNYLTVFLRTSNNSSWVSLSSVLWRLIYVSTYSK